MNHNNKKKKQLTKLNKYNTKHNQLKLPLGSLSIFPIEILCLVFDFLEIQDLFRLTGTCKSLNFIKTIPLKQTFIFSKLFKCMKETKYDNMDLLSPNMVLHIYHNDYQVCQLLTNIVNIIKQWGTSIKKINFTSCMKLSEECINHIIKHCPYVTHVGCHRYTTDNIINVMLDHWKGIKEINIMGPNKISSLQTDILKTLSPNINIIDNISFLERISRKNGRIRGDIMGKRSLFITEGDSAMPYAKTTSINMFQNAFGSYDLNPYRGAAILPRPLYNNPDGISLRYGTNNTSQTLQIKCPYGIKYKNHTLKSNDKYKYLNLYDDNWNDTLHFHTYNKQNDKQHKHIPQKINFKKQWIKFPRARGTGKCNK